MKLHSLHIGAYRGLNDLTLTFPSQDGLPVYLLVGVNGTGKTGILRVLTRIFNDLDDAQAPPFPFALEYAIGRGTENFRVTIRGDGSGATSGVEFGVTDSQGARSTRERGEWRTFLPDRIVIYTSGSVDEWERLMAEGDDDRERREQDQAEAVRALTRNAQEEIQELDAPAPFALNETIGETEPSRIYLMTHGQLQLALLATLALEQIDEQELRGEIYKRAGVQRLTHFSLHLARESSPTKTFEENILPRIQKLAGRAQKIIRYRDGSYHLVFEMTTDTRRQLSDDMQRGAVQFYEFLVDLQTRGVLANVDLVIEKENVNVPLLGRHLSDGEFELLGRMALFFLLHQPEALFLLDEPETHFNDVWKRELVDILARILHDEPSTVLLTTHSSIVLSDVPTEQVIVLDKNSFGQVEVVETIPPLFGADPGEIMQNVFRVPRAGEYATNTLRDAIERGDRAVLQQLLNQVGPGYWRFRILDRLEQLDAAPDQPSQTSG